MSKRGLNIYRRKDGRYEGRYSVERYADGKKKYCSIYGKTYAVVKEKLIKLIAADVKPPKKSAVTVQEISVEWLTANESRIKQSTYANYRTKLESHIFPKLGNVRYDTLTTTQINNFVSETLKNGRRKNGGALSESYVRDIVIMMKSIGKFAARTHGLHNPCEDVVIPKPKQKAVAVISNRDEIKLVAYLKSNLNLVAVAILMAMYAGLRIGEICALTWADIDFDKRVIKVRKTIQRIRNFGGGDSAKTRLVVTPPKSEKSNRDVPITDFLFEILQQFKGNDDCYVVSGTTKFVDPRTVQYGFNQVLKKAELSSLRFHSLRHAFATTCARTPGFDTLTLSEILGHKNVETTLKMYVHTSDERKHECMKLLKPAA